MKFLYSFILAFLLLAGCAAPAAESARAVQPVQAKPLKVLLLGGGNSHDFKRWYGDTDSTTLRELEGVTVSYTEDVDSIVPQLAATDVLCIANNKPFTQAATRQAIMDFANQGKGIVLLHAGMWYSWRDWPEFNRVLVGGGSRGHDQIHEFTVTITDPAHPIMKGLPITFLATDELYNQEIDPAGTPIHPLATSFSTLKNKAFASVFIVEHPKAKIVGIALGHDGRVHDLAPYKQLLKSSVEWAGGR